MTFCVLAFASNGWLMAADRAQLRETGQLARIRTQGSTQKICWNETARVAACFAGDSPVETIARDIVEAIKSGTFDRAEYQDESKRRKAIDDIAKRALENDKLIWGNEIARNLMRRSVILVLPSGEIWLISGREGDYDIGARLVTQRSGAMYIGDDPNPAVYLIQRYYPIFDSRLRPVRDLIFLVAHTVLEAHSFNQHSVAGLDLLTYTNASATDAGGFHLFSEEELNSLAKTSADTYQMLLKHFFPQT